MKDKINTLIAKGIRFIASIISDYYFSFVLGFLAVYIIAYWAFTIVSEPFIWLFRLFS